MEKVCGSMDEDDFGFELRIQRAREIVSKLNDPNLSLKEGMKLYKEGFTCLCEAQKILQEARVEYEEIKRKGQL